MKDRNPASTRKAPAQESTGTGPFLSLPMDIWMIQRELCASVVVRWDQNPAFWHQLNSPCLEEEECCLWSQEHHPHSPNTEVETLCFGGVFLLRGQDPLHHIKGTMDRAMYRQGQGIENGFMDGYSSMTKTQTLRPKQQRSGSRRSTLKSWSGLSSLQHLIPFKICGGNWRFELPNVSL